MTDAALLHAVRIDEANRPSYRRRGRPLASWLLSTDHKRIAILYALSITFFFAIGGVAIGLVRLELITPHGTFLSDNM